MVYFILLLTAGVAAFVTLTVKNNSPKSEKRKADDDKTGQSGKA